MCIKYTILGLEPITSWTRVSCQLDQGPVHTAAYYQMRFFIDNFPRQVFKQTLWPQNSLLVSEICLF